MNDDLDPIPLSALNQYGYCPRRCWLIYVTGEFLSNPYTVEGEIIHERAHHGEDIKRGDLIQLRHVQVYSHRLGLIGYADVIEKKADELYPVEHKRGRRGQWQNDQLQLAAQALCLEEMTGRPVPKGYIYYAISHHREPVNITPDLRADVEQTVRKVRALLASPRGPLPNPKPRCRGCSLYSICLPREAQKLRTLTGKEFP
jgi:CRISPR-associated exonuclease Cas4